MSYKKALEVLGISEAVMEEERAKMLGGLGVRAWANPVNSTGTADRNQNAGSCGGLFGKRPHGHTLHPGSARMFDMAPTEVRGFFFLRAYFEVYIKPKLSPKTHVLIVYGVIFGRRLLTSYSTYTIYSA